MLEVSHRFQALILPIHWTHRYVWVVPKTIYKLCQSVFDTGRTVYTDRYYTSPILAHYLRKVGLYFCGTSMTNRKGFPKTLIDQSRKSEQGSYQWQQCQTTGIVATRWMDKRPIYFVLTGLLPEDADCFVTRHDKAGKDLRVKCIPAVQTYNAMMGGVDVSDKMARLDKSRKSYRWYTRIDRKMVMPAMVNAFLIYQARGRATDL